MRPSVLTIICCALIVGACAPNSDDSTNNHVTNANLQASVELPDEFGDYWYQGKAELTSYSLSQARYGELRDGEAVMIFVTEDFSRSKNVKLNNPYTAGDDAVKVLKLNLTKNFLTGIYPYSLMSSVFTPVYDAEPTLKVTTSSQEWCGHSFSAIDREDSGYLVRTLSYFEDESESYSLPDVLLEDAIWTTIRLNPDRLPQGSFEMVPGQMFQRLGHIGADPVDANATLSASVDGIRSYTLNYPAMQRSLIINFQDSFPFEIEGWEETHTSGSGANARELTTTAKAKKRLMNDYWSRNSNADEPLRVELGLDS